MTTSPPRFAAALRRRRKATKSTPPALFSPPVPCTPLEASGVSERNLPVAELAKVQNPLGTTEFLANPATRKFRCDAALVDAGETHARRSHSLRQVAARVGY